jgi:hypothetical protein
LARRGQHEEACERFESAANGYRASLGEDHVNVGKALWGLGQSARAMGEHERAKEAFEDVISIFEGHYGSDHERTERVRQALDQSAD